MVGKPSLEKFMYGLLYLYVIAKDANHKLLSGRHKYIPFRLNVVVTLKNGFSRVKYIRLHPAHRQQTNGSDCGCASVVLMAHSNRLLVEYRSIAL